MKSDLESLLNDLGVSMPDDVLSDEDPPEAVDEFRIAAFYRNELDPDEAEWVAYLISHFRAWHQAGIQQAHEDAETPVLVSDHALRDQFVALLRTQLGPYVRGEQSIGEFDSRTVAATALNNVFQSHQPKDDELIQLYRLAVTEISDAMRHFSVKCLDEEVATTSTETAIAAETTFSTSQTHPKVILRRLDRLAELIEVDKELAFQFQLRTFVGLTTNQMVALLHKPADEIDENLRLATIDICLQDD